MGVANAFVDDANPFSNLSEKTSRDNEKHYQIGQAVGHFVAAIVGTAEVISGGGTALGGGAVAVVTSPTGVGAVAGAGVAAGGVVIAAHGAMMVTMAAKNMSGQKAKIDNANNGSKADSSKPTGNNNSKVEKSKTTESVGGKYTKTTEVRSGKGSGQSRAEYVRYKNKDGKVIRTYKDSYDRANKFQHRKPLRGGPEGRPQND